MLKIGMLENGLPMAAILSKVRSPEELSRMEEELRQLVLKDSLFLLQ